MSPGLFLLIWSPVQWTPSVLGLSGKSFGQTTLFLVSSLFPLSALVVFHYFL